LVPQIDLQKTEQNVLLLCPMAICVVSS